MGYQGFVFNDDQEDTTNGWQLRIHIAPEAINETNELNKLDVIKRCVEEVFGQDKVYCKIYQIDAEDTGHDGALSPTGKDRTQFGKEVCIILPNADVTQPTAAEYKQKLLHLWHLLQENQVPLLQFTPPGDKPILIQGSDVPTPFSFTSNNPSKEELDEHGNAVRGEWSERHGILFKEFEPHGQHPILDVTLSAEDLSDQDIDLSESLTSSTETIQSHNTEVTGNIQLALQDIQEQAWSFEADILLGEPPIETELKRLARAYREGNDACEGIEDRARFQDRFNQELLANKRYQQFITYYPHLPDSDFSEDPRINRIRSGIKNEDLSDEDIDRLVAELKAAHQYGQELTSFTQELNALNLPGNYDTTALYRKNPLEMQQIYRQMALISQEADQNQIISEENSAIINLLEAYKSERETKSPHEYFGYFSIFSRGGYSKKEKFEAVDALIASIKDSELPLKDEFLGPLKQGNLFKYVETLGLDLQYYTEREAPEEDDEDDMAMKGGS